MRKGKRFTPKLLRSWHKAQRGTGIGKSYLPWHMVSRGDPGSQGRSHLINSALTGRMQHLLSDHERLVYSFALMLPGLIDVREQFPLSYEEHQTEISAWQASALAQVRPGTCQLARQLNIKHPTLSQHGETESWVPTTDLLLTLRTSDGGIELLAISIKDGDEIQKKRTSELLKLEQQYWLSQGVTWLLVTKALYLQEVANSIRTSYPWGLTMDLADPLHLDLVASLVPYLDDQSLTKALGIIQERLGVEQQAAQRIFWQGVWQGRIPIDLSRSSWPSAPIHIISLDQFQAQNPIAMRRSACL